MRHFGSYRSHSGFYSKRTKKFDIENLFDYACQFAFQSTDEELVKLGIGLLGLFDLSNDDKIIDKLLVLALYEEFTLT